MELKLMILKSTTQRPRGGQWLEDLLSGFQGDDDEDGSPVHAAHTAAVAHEVVQDGGELRAHLQQEKASAGGH